MQLTRTILTNTRRRTPMSPLRTFPRSTIQLPSRMTATLTFQSTLNLIRNKSTLKLHDQIQLFEHTAFHKPARLQSQLHRHHPNNQHFRRSPRRSPSSIIIPDTSGDLFDGHCTSYTLHLPSQHKLKHLEDQMGCLVGIAH